MAFDFFLKSTPIKFKLWNFARQHPQLGRPIVFLGRIATRRIQKDYRRLLQDRRESLSSNDRYRRAIETPTQILVILGQEADPDDRTGAALFLNHLRLPYRLIELQNGPFPTHSLKHIAVVIFIGRDPHSAVLQFDSSDSRAIILHLGPMEQTDTHPKNHLIQLDARFKDLLPWNEGLLSPLTARLVHLLMERTTIPLITGRLPAGVALRLDDIDGREISHYLPPILEHGWKPNMGVFLEGIARADESVKTQLANQAHQGRLDISPHAFSANEFIYFDFPHGKPWGQAAFSERWKRVKRDFSDWSFPISPVLNSHFHVLSSACLPILAEEGVRYHYSELALDETIRQPGAAILPSGDPEATTGQSGHPGFQQIYSGDSTLYCNQPTSHYDFLMHTKRDALFHDATARLLDRLKLTLNCGFASFVTTHEYLLAQLPVRIHRAFWDEVESAMESIVTGPLQKVSLIELGQRCSDHTTTVIESVRQLESGRWVIQLSGSSAGAGALSVFQNGFCREVPIPAFTNAYEMEVSL